MRSVRLYIISLLKYVQNSRNVIRMQMELEILQLVIQTGADLSFHTVKNEIQSLNFLRNWTREIKLEQEEALNTPPKCFVCVVFLFSLK